METNNEEIKNTEAQAQFNKTTKTDLYKIDPRLVKVVDGFNSRTNFDLDELMPSIRENGVMNPITVQKEKDENGNEFYTLVDGERRLRSVLQLIKEGVDIPRIPALITSKSKTKDELLIEQYTRNQGKPFNEYETGLLIKKLVDFGYTPSEAVKKLGLQPWKVIFLTHLERDPKVQELMKQDKISGPDVRRIYSAYKNPDTGKVDEQAAVKDIVETEKKIESGEVKAKKVTVKAMGKGSKSVIIRDSADIRKGLGKLLEYYRDRCVDKGIEAELDLVDVYNKLGEKKTIDVIMDECIKAAQQEQTIENGLNETTPQTEEDDDFSELNEAYPDVI